MTAIVYIVISFIQLYVVALESPWPLVFAISAWINHPWYRASVNIYSSLSCNGNLFFISDGSVFVPGPVPVSCHITYGSIADYSWSPPQPSVLHYIIPKRDRVQSSSLINFYMIYGERRYEINQYDEVKESRNINLMDFYIPSCFLLLVQRLCRLPMMTEEERHKREEFISLMINSNGIIE